MKGVLKTKIAIAVQSLRLDRELWIKDWWDGGIGGMEKSAEGINGFLHQSALWKCSNVHSTNQPTRESLNLSPNYFSNASQI